MTDRRLAALPWAQRTVRGPGRETPLRAFLRTETGSAAVLLCATLAALAWVNVDAHSYELVWRTPFTVRLGAHGIGQDLRGWVNSGLMTLFFFVVGLEARREFDMGELRDRRRLALPVAAGVGGMVVPIAIFLATNVPAGSGRGWGTAMATDTAFALGMLALVGKSLPDRLRIFLLTVAVVDDLVSLGVIAFFYTERIAVPALVVALALFAAVLVVRARRIRSGPVHFVLGVATWAAMYESGIDPVVVGLAMGLVTYAYPAPRGELERASDLFRLFREQPTPELERSARAGLDLAISPNERLALFYHPWTSYLIVPLFALANAGIAIDGQFLMRAYRSPITIGIVIGYLVGKPVGVVGATWLISTLSRGRLRPPVGWAAVAGAGTIAGIGFTVSLLVATLAFTGVELEEAKLGVLTAAAGASAITWLVFRVIAMLPPLRRARALLSTADTVIDLAVPVDGDRDHIRGPRGDDALVTVVEYGDFECPYCGRAEPVVRELLAGHAEIRYVWRHLPLHDVHPHAQLAAEAAEAAAAQDAFWDMHDLLFENQEALGYDDLVGYARQLGLDVERFRDSLSRNAGAARVAEDLDSADQSGVSGTPTFFINGLRHHGAYDIESLSEAVRTAKTREYLRR